MVYLARVVLNVHQINTLQGRVDVKHVQMDAPPAQVQVAATLVQQVVALVVMVYLALVVLNVQQINILQGQVDAKHVQATVPLVCITLAQLIV